MKTLKLSRAFLICFISYLLATTSFYFFYKLTQESNSAPFTHNENAHPLIATLDVLGYAAAAMFDELGLWLRFIFFSILLHILFLVTLKLILNLSIKRLILLIVVTLSLSFILCYLLHPILQWIFGFYYSITAALIITTFFVAHWEGYFKVEE